MRAERLTDGRRLHTLASRDARAAPDRTITTVLGTLGALGTLAGLWGLLAPEGLAGASATLLADAGARIQAGLFLGALLLGLATYLTAWWAALDWTETVAGWLLAAGLWLVAMLLLSPALDPYRAPVARMLANPAELRALGLILLLVGTTLLKAAIMMRCRRAIRKHTPRRVTRPSGHLRAA